MLVKVLVFISLGGDLEPQANEPYLATSLKDFWGRRWNPAHCPRDPPAGLLHPGAATSQTENEILSGYVLGSFCSVPRLRCGSQAGLLLYNAWDAYRGTYLALCVTWSLHCCGSGREEEYVCAAVVESESGSFTAPHSWVICGCDEWLVLFPSSYKEWHDRKTR